MWVGIEVRILALMPIITQYKLTRLNEAALKYFLIQIPAGLLFLGGRLTMLERETLFFLALLIKLGAFPFFAWMPHIFSGISFSHIFLLSTLQKIPPLVTLASFNFFVSAVSLLTISVGAFGGLFLTNIKKMLAYSSISHTGWMLRISAYFYMWVSYLIFYSFLLFFLFKQLTSAQIKSISQVSTLASSGESMRFWVLILSLAGLPPLLGFTLKWISLGVLFHLWGLLILPVVVLFRLSLYFYAQIIISNTILINSPKSLSTLSPLFLIFLNVRITPLFFLILFN